MSWLLELLKHILPFLKRKHSPQEVKLLEAETAVKRTDALKTLEQDQERLYTVLTELRGQIAELKADNIRRDKEIDSLKQRLAEEKREIDNLRLENDKQNRIIETQRSKISELQRKLKTLMNK